MKKRWETPQAVVQEFEPNEYVAVCWSVACAVGNANRTNYGGYAGTVHNRNWSYWNNLPPVGNQAWDHTGSCSNSANNQFRVDNGQVSFVSENSSDQGELAGRYTSYIENGSDGVVSDGDIIFWYTQNPDGRRWNHYGTVVDADPSHPNRS